MRLIIKLLLSNKKIVPGGSANNSACGLSMLEEEVSFIGKIGNDHYGQIYLDQNKEHHVETGLMIVDNKTTTGLSLVYVTPDGERTMNTFPGHQKSLIHQIYQKLPFVGFLVFL